MINFLCQNEQWKLCCVGESYGGMLDIKTCECHGHCNYRLPFNSGYLCQCPVMIEINRKFGT